MKTRPTHTNVDLIAIVEPRLMFRKGLRQTLAQLRKLSEVIEAKSCEELEIKYPGRIPNIIFVSGTGFSDIDILNQANRLRRYSPLAGIAVYDNRASIDFLLAYFRNSFGGYLPENFDDRDLDMCINTLALGFHYVNSEIAYQLITQKPLRLKQSRITTLSGLEKKVADCLIRGMSTSEIAQTLDRRSSTISTVKSNIYKKTNVHNIIDLAIILGRQGAPVETLEAI